MSQWHLIQGEAGCAFAVEHGCVAIVVDALRASATAAMMLDAGARELVVVREVEEAFAAKRVFPDALLFGERGGLPPDGFDFGNSPRTVQAARDRTVIFSTTTGAGRLVSCWGAPAILMATTVNATAAARAALRLAGDARDIVLIPAGLATDPEFSAQEDWVAATAIATRGQALAARQSAVATGADIFAYWQSRIEAEGLCALFESAPHSEKLRRVHLEEDIEYCARTDLTAAVPVAVDRVDRDDFCGIRVVGYTGVDR